MKPLSPVTDIEAVPQKPTTIAGKPWFLATWGDILGPWGCVILAAFFAALTAWYLAVFGLVFGAFGPLILTIAWGVGAGVQFRRKARTSAAG